MLIEYIDSIYYIINMTCIFSRLFDLLRASYITTPGSVSSRLETTKRVAMELLSISSEDDSDKSLPPMVAKHQLQEDIAAIRRIKRVPLADPSDEVDIKKLLQSGACSFMDAVNQP